MFSISRWTNTYGSGLSSKFSPLILPLKMSAIIKFSSLFFPKNASESISQKEKYSPVASPSKKSNQDISSIPGPKITSSKEKVPKEIPPVSDQHVPSKLVLGSPSKD